MSGESDANPDTGGEVVAARPLGRLGLAQVLHQAGHGVAVMLQVDRGGTEEDAQRLVRAVR